MDDPIEAFRRSGQPDELRNQHIGQKERAAGQEAARNKTRGEKQSRRQDVEWEAGLEEADAGDRVRRCEAKAKAGDDPSR